MSASPTKTADLAPPIAPTETESESSSAKTPPATHTISVAPKQSPHAYEPRSIEANVGDEIVFEFYPTNHSVVRADFDAPCVPATDNVFFSGHYKLTSYSKPEIWTWTVDTAEPTFFYCTAIGSCTKNGMVGAINPNETMSWEHQHNKAMQAPFQLEPGEHPPPEGGESGPPGSAPTSPPGGSSRHGLSGGAIAGIVVGAVVGVAILGALFFLLGRLEIYRKWRQSEDGTSVDRTRRWALSSGGGGIGGWSSGAKSEAGGAPASEMGGTAVSSHPGHMSYISTDNRHLSAGFPSSSPPPPWGWDKQGGGNLNGVMESHNQPAGIPGNAPHEMSGEGPGNIVELDAGPYHPPPSVSPNPNAGQ
ncbi:hypothetical protein GX51_02230 [Blastomyces parvus]|uniref:Extracellular serine-rich protein n=1 Tax=Blastomyces parvus TaxID=2060905 RepID=A0A2B7XCY5_9EURO|nr:hypothetical protein GX51_02230 [Blastomyces parvus]